MEVAPEIEQVDGSTSSKTIGKGASKLLRDEVATIPVNLKDRAGTTFQVKITGRDTASDGEGKPFVVYRHEARSGEQEWVILSRYSRFAWLDEQVRLAYKGNHLLSSVPQLPKKQWKIMVDHLSADFLDERQQQLEFYLQAVSRLPGIEKVDAFYQFLTTNYTGPEQEDDGNGDLFSESSDPNIVLAGFLIKQGLKAKNWKRRWFTLSKSGLLLYFANPRDKKEKGAVSLDPSHCAVRCLDSAIPRPFCIQLITPQRVYLIAADSEQHQEQWYRALLQFSTPGQDEEGYSGIDDFI